jgi:hypothetical protein
MLLVASTLPIIQALGGHDMTTYNASPRRNVTQPYVYKGLCQVVMK